MQIHPVIIGDPLAWHDDYYIKPRQKLVKWILETKEGVLFWYHPKSSITWDLELDEIEQGEFICNANTSIKWTAQDVFASDYTSGLRAIKN